MAIHEYIDEKEYLGLRTYWVSEESTSDVESVKVWWLIDKNGGPKEIQVDAKESVRLQAGEDIRMVLVDGTPSKSLGNPSDLGPGKYNVKIE